MRQHPKPELSRHIERLVRALALAYDWTIGRSVEELARRTSYSEATVYRWRQGTLLPDVGSLAVLAKLGLDAGLTRDWGQGLLRSGQHLLAPQMIEDLWGREPTPILNNLPAPGYTKFVGRKAEFERLLALLSADRPACVIIEGQPGVGKTALALEAAHRFLAGRTGAGASRGSQRFDAIAFVSAKPSFITAQGVVGRLAPQRSAVEMFHEIATVVNRTPSELAESEPTSAIRRAVLSRSVLLIIDNVDTLEDKSSVLSFLHDLPSNCKAIVTSRERAGLPSIRLQGLNEQESSELVDRFAESMELLLSCEETAALCQAAQGNPTFLLHALGQLAGGRSLEGALRMLHSPEGAIGQFVFMDTVNRLSIGARHVLMSAAIFETGSSAETLAYVAGIPDPVAAEEALVDLHRVFLLDENRGRWTISSAFKTYAVSLLREDPDFERESRSRYEEWCLERSHADADAAAQSRCAASERYQSADELPDKASTPEERFCREIPFDGSDLPATRSRLASERGTPVAVA